MSSCVSSEVKRASDGLVSYSYVYVVLVSVVLISGGWLWWIYRRNIWLYRRNPRIVAFYYVAMLGNLTIGPIYRIALNSEVLFFSSCGFGNTLIVAGPALFLIPNLIRIALFHTRVQLAKTLVSLDTRRSMVAYESQVDLQKMDTIPDANTSVFFRSKKYLSSTRMSLTLSDKEEKKIRKYKFRASEKFGFRLALLIFAIIISLAGAITLSTCPMPRLGSSTCEYGLANGFLNYIVVLPLIPLIVGTIYYSRLARKYPDPFQVKKEIYIYFVIALGSLFAFGLHFFNIGGFTFDLKDPQFEDRNINFKFLILVDYMALLTFIHAFHYQVYCSIKYENNLMKEYPIGLEEVLDHPEASVMYKSYLQTEFSVELYIVYKLITAWKKNRAALKVIPKQSGLSSQRSQSQLDVKSLPPVEDELAASDERARDIFSTWIDPSGDNIVVNIGYQLLEELRENIQDEIVTDGDGHYDRDLFDDLQIELLRLMRDDSFVRFANSTDYKIFSGLQEATFEPDNESFL